MLHISMKTGQTLTIDGVGYTLAELDTLNGGTRVTVSSEDGEQDYWIYIGGDTLKIDDTAEIAVHSIAPSFARYAKFTLISDRIHDITFPKH